MAFTRVNETLTTGANTFLGFGKNRLFNGAMRISQMNAGNLTSTTTGGVSAYPADMFVVTSFQGSTTAVFSAQQLSATPPTGFQNYIRMTTTTSEASPAAGVQAYFATYIEGYTSSDWLMGTASAKTVTISFWIRSSLTGTFSVGFKNENSDRGYASTYTINSANTWEQKTVSLTLDTTGTWETGNLRGIQVLWDLGAGSNFEATANTWTAGNKYKVAGTTRLAATNAATIDITGVQFELGPDATNFEYVPMYLDIARCQRYYEKTYNIGTAIAAATSTGAYNPGTTSTGAGAAFIDIRFKATKRAAPTMTGYSNAGTLGSWTYDRNGASGSVTLTFVVGDAGGYVQTSSIGANWAVVVTSGHWIADARLQ